MKKFLFVLVCVALCCMSAAGVEELPNGPSFAPLSPKILGQGGGYTAIAEGYEALFTNPAGFAMETGRKGREITIVSANPWFYGRPDYLLPFTYELTQGADLASSVSLISDQITTGGFGVGSSVGIGYVGKGLGLGFISVFDSYLYGQKLLGAEGEVHLTFAFIGGLAVPLKLGKIEILIGGDVRPMLRIYSPLENQAVLGILSALINDESIFSVLNPQKSYSGIGLAVDAGILMKFGGLSLGFSARDILGTKFYYNTGTFENDFGGFLSGNIPEGGAIEATALTPTNLSLGLSYRPRFEKIQWLFDPVVYLEAQDLLGLIQGRQTFWTTLHGGLEVKLLSFFNIRGGISQGYLTFGGGFKLLAVDINAAIFTRELGTTAGDRPNSGVTVEAAVRF
jgi:hypothetical protein